MRRLMKMGALVAMLLPLAACQIDELSGPSVTAGSPKKPSTDGKRPATVVDSAAPKDEAGSTKSRFAMAAE